MFYVKSQILTVLFVCTNLLSIVSFVKISTTFIKENALKTVLLDSILISTNVSVFPKPYRIVSNKLSSQSIILLIPTQILNIQKVTDILLQSTLLKFKMKTILSDSFLYTMATWKRKLMAKECLLSHRLPQSVKLANKVMVWHLLVHVRSVYRIVKYASFHLSYLVSNAIHFTTWQILRNANH